MQISACPNSLPIRVDNAASIFQPLAENAVTFYQAQRDGPNVIGSVMSRQPSHLTDEKAIRYQNPSINANGELTALPKPVCFRSALLAP